MPTAASGLPEDVHVIVLGWEYDRAVLPFLSVSGRPPRFYAHRVYLIVPNPLNARDYDERVKEALEKITEVVMVPLQMGNDSRDFEILLRKMLDICRKETARGNRIHINISAGSRLSALVGGLVGMALLDETNGSTYYVRPLDYPVDDDEQDKHGLSSGMKDVHALPQFNLHVPKPAQLRILALARGTADWTVSFQEVARHLAETEGADDLRPVYDEEAPRAARSKALITLRRRYLDPLEEADYIDTFRDGRVGKVRLHKKGELYALLAPGPSVSSGKTDK